MTQDISINELVDKLNKDGFLTLYVNFDTGKGTIKPESDKTSTTRCRTESGAESVK